VTPAWQCSVPRFQTLTHVLENGRQLPLAEDVGMIQSSRPPLQFRQIMQRVEHLAARFVAALVPGNHLAGHDNLDAVDVRLHGCRLKSASFGNTVTHPVESRRLILVDLGRFIDAGIEGRTRQRQGALPITLETLADRLSVVPRGALPILQTAVAQVSVELCQILDTRHRRRPAALQGLDAILHVGLFVTVGGQAKQRLEDVVTGQGLIAFVQTALPAAEDGRRPREWS